MRRTKHFVSGLERPRFIDLAWPKGKSPTQEEILSKYKPSQEKDMDRLSPDDFAQIPMLRKRVSTNAKHGAVLRPVHSMSSASVSVVLS